MTQSNGLMVQITPWGHPYFWTAFDERTSRFPTQASVP
jgi:hypothetical protein